MSNTNEVVKLVKFSPKRENLLGEVKSNLKEEDATAAGLTKFSALGGLFAQPVFNGFLITTMHF